MASNLDNFKELIEKLIKEKNSQQNILTFLKNQFGDQKGFSERSLRRFISQHNLNHKLNQDQLNEIVSDVIKKVGPSYGRRMLKGALNSFNVNVCERRITKAVVAADPENHKLRLGVFS